MDSLLLNFEEVARLIVFSPATVANWAYRRKPAPQGFPQPIKIGRILRYRRMDIEVWIANLGAIEPCLPSAGPNSAGSAHSIKRSRGRPRLIDEVIRG